MFRILILFSATLIAFSSCGHKKTIARQKDYSAYMVDGMVAKEAGKVSTEIDFWKERLQNDTGSYVYMLELASNYLRLFRHTGGINALQFGDEWLKRSSAKLANKDPEILYALSQHSITRHQFLAAASYNEIAEKAKGDLYTICLLQFDVNMELGKYEEAYKSLQSLVDRTGFDYLIRKAKWEDHKGNLDGAIKLMEKAFEKVKDKKRSLYCWTLSNLADMYGHAGRVKESYEAYLNVLEKDPSNLYCLKGIAWINYAHDNNTTEAKRIIQYILSETELPDLKLMLAQIAETEGHADEKQRLMSEFVMTVTKPEYGDMYNKYLIELYSEELNDHEKAVALAEKELKNRFTPETCDWVAWTYFNKGEFAKALDFSNGYVYKKTFEPVATMHTAFIYAANGKNDEAKRMLKDCLVSSFELGPISTKRIEEKLKVL